MIAALLPDGVTVADMYGLGRPDLLAPDERAQLGAAAPRRVREFAAGRACARRALAMLGAPAAAVLRGADRQPLWPAGVVGSITHCAGYCAAATARRGQVVAIGIDAEPRGALPPGVLERIALPSEARFVAEHAGDGICWDRILFSAKESVFKAWYPLTGLWLGFDEARLSFVPDERRFEATLLVPGPRIGGVLVQHFAGRLAMRHDLVATAVAVEAHQSPTQTFLGRVNASSPARPPVRP